MSEETFPNILKWTFVRFIWIFYPLIIFRLSDDHVDEQSIMELLPRGSGISAADEAEKLKSDIQDYIDGLPPQFPLADITE